MRRMTFLVGAMLVGGTAIVGTTVGLTSASAEPDIHSDEARAAWCSRAQMFVGGTELVAENVIHTEVATFVDSDATPYDTDEGRDLPLTTHQLVSTVEHPTEARVMDAVLSCKLKGGQALQQHYGQDAAELGHFCTDAHADIADRVFSALTAAEQERLVYTRDQVVMDPDIPAAGGGDWTSGQPQGGDFVVPQVAFEEADGLLHLRAKALIVPTVGVDVPPFVPRNKQGTHYCHLVAPDHLREIVTGDLVRSTDAPPAPAPGPDTEPGEASPDGAEQARTEAAPPLAETGGGAIAVSALLGLGAWATRRRR